MIRTLMLIIAGVVLAAPAALGQSSNGEGDDSRYTFNRADDGFTARWTNRPSVAL
jgi:hypothetical protein